MDYFINRGNQKNFEYVLKGLLANELYKPEYKNSYNMETSFSRFGYALIPKGRRLQAAK